MTAKCTGNQTFASAKSTMLNLKQNKIMGQSNVWNLSNRPLLKFIFLSKHI